MSAYEGRFRDVLSLILTAAVEPNRALAEAVAEQLGRLLMRWPVTVIWRSGQGRGTLFDAARCLAPGRTLRIPSHDAAALLARLDQGTTAITPPIRRTELSGDTYHAVRLSLTSDSNPPVESLTVIVEAQDQAFESDRWAVFAAHVPSQRDLLMAYIAIERARQAARRSEALAIRALSIAELNERVDDLLEDVRVGPRSPWMDQRRPLVERAKEAVELINGAIAPRLPRAMFARALTRILGWLLNEALANDALDVVEAAGLAALDALEGANQAEVSTQDCATMRTLSRLDLNASLLVGIAPQNQTWQQHVGPDWVLLFHWTQVTTMAEGVADRRSGADRRAAQALWDERLGDGAALATQLKWWHGPEKDNALTVRRWLQLWFAQRLLCVAGTEAWRKRQTLQTDRWRFRANLAYVLREVLRYFVQGHHSTYRFSADRYYAALNGLIEQHALWVLDLPQELDLAGGLFDLPAADSEVSRGFAQSHLRHVANVYVGVVFLGQLQLGDSRATLASILAGEAHRAAGPGATRKVEQVAGLSALYHDVGALIFPRATFPGDSVDDATLDPLRDGLRTAGKDVVERSAEAIAPYLTDADGEIRAWIETQREDARPAHALLSARQLDQISERLPPRSHALIHAAIRATLLHEAVTQPVDLSRDPGAVLLVLADILFDWEPTWRIPRQGGRRSSVGLIRANSPDDSRAAAITLIDLDVQISGAEVCCLVPSTDEQPGPRVALRLRAPNNLPRWGHLILLTIAQNLSRLGVGPRFVPQMDLYVGIPKSFQDPGIDTLLALELITERVRIPFRGALRRWLGTLGPRSEEGVDVFILRGGGAPAFGADIRPFLVELEAATTEVLRG